MNTPNPLIPQGTFPDTRRRAHVRIAVFAIIAVHIVLFGGLLMLGCRKPTGEQEADKGPSTNFAPFVPPVDTNPPPVAVQTSTPPVVTPLPPVNLVNPSTPPPISDLVPPAAGTEHVVVKGDSFYTIGKKYGVTTKAMQEANPGVDSSRLKIGQKLKVPASSGSPARSMSSGGSPSVSAEKTYVVKSGDNLMKIAKANGTSVKALRSVNALKTDQIKVGQKLKIPAKTTAPIVDTLSSPTASTGTPATSTSP